MSDKSEPVVSVRDAVERVLGWHVDSRAIRPRGPAFASMVADQVDELLEDTLDAAWAEAEAALPEGWRLAGLTYELVLPYQATDIGAYDEWTAEATGLACGHCGSGLACSGQADTPAGALRDLAARLRESGRK